MLEIRLGDRLIRGIQAGITEQGTLRLEVANETLIFNSGEVSLRLAYPEAAPATTRTG